MVQFDPNLTQTILLGWGGFKFIHKVDRPHPFSRGGKSKIVETSFSIPIDP